MKSRYIILIVLLFLAALLGGLKMLISLPINGSKTVSQAIGVGEKTSLGLAFKKELETHPDQSGMYLLSNGLDAFVGRVVLARQAERSIDVQYYMFHQDIVGRLLLKELAAAADRGVRVRLLVDDMYGEDGDDTWLSLNTHPLFEVRLFNPFVRGYSKNLQFITRFKEVNHRMHSKTFTVDNQATVVGGRNIGDEYFDADPDLAFADMDVLAIGPVVPDVSREFDQYWNSDHAFPISTLLPEKHPLTFQTVHQQLEASVKENAASAYIRALEDSDLAKALTDKTARFSFSKAIVIHDSPEKMDMSKAGKKDLLMSQLAPYIMESTEQFVLVSPYFVPGQPGADALCDLSEQGLQIQVLTNSLVSNDVAAVHAGYTRHRKQLLRCGVVLYELNEQTKKEARKLFTWLPGLKKSSLHAKWMILDRQAMFVGSFNFDQRSLNINNEIGILFDDHEIAEQETIKFDDNIEDVAFRVELVKDEKGQETMRWSGTENGKKVIFSEEPYASYQQKAGVKLMRMLPIDSLL